MDMLSIVKMGKGSQQWWLVHRNVHSESPVSVVYNSQKEVKLYLSFLMW